MTDEQLQKELEAHAGVIHGSFVELSQQFLALQTTFEVGFGDLEAFVGDLSRIDQELTMQQAILKRQEDRLLALETGRSSF